MGLWGVAGDFLVLVSIWGVGVRFLEQEGFVVVTFFR